MEKKKYDRKLQNEIIMAKKQSSLMLKSLFSFKRSNTHIQSLILSSFTLFGFTRRVRLVR